MAYVRGGVLRNYLKKTYSLSEDVIKVLISFWLGLLIISCIIRFYPFEGNSKNLYSVLDFTLKTNNWGFALMFGGYLISLILLARSVSLKLLSFVMFLLGYTGAFLGIFINGPGMMGYDLDKYGKAANSLAMIFPLFYIFIPVIVIYMYLPFLVGEKGRKKELEKSAKIEQEERKPESNKAIFLAILCVILFTVGWWKLAMYGYHQLHCLKIGNCSIWSTDFASNGFIVTGLLFALIIVMAIGKGSTKNDVKFARIFLPFTFLIFVGSSYISYQTYTITTDVGIKSRDMAYELLNGVMPVNLRWDEVQSFNFLHITTSSTSSSKSGSCAGTFIQLVLKNGERIKMLPHTKYDYDLSEYLKKERKLPKNDAIQATC